MGRSKAGLELGGESLINRVLKILTPICQEVIVVTRRPSDFLDLDVMVVRDLVPGQGPLGGLATGLFYARQAWALALACDLPFLRPSLLGHLARKALAAPRGPRSVVPRTEGGWEPLLAVYSRDCLPKIREVLDKGGRKLYELRTQGVTWQEVGLDELRAVDQDLVSFFNINTPDDLEQAKTWAEGE